MPYDRLRTLFSLAIVAAALMLWITTTSCGAGPTSEESNGPSGPLQLSPQEPVDALEVENSGRTISGTFRLDEPVPPAISTVMVFSEDGAFARLVVLPNDRRSVTLGTYVVDTSNNLVLYVEERDDARFNTARRTVVHLGGDLANRLVLTDPLGQVEVYTKSVESNESDPKPPRVD